MIMKLDGKKYDCFDLNMNGRWVGREGHLSCLRECINSTASTK